ncbi:MAG: 5-formyltetrahydrofolate cyclo-ligase [Paucimonas sp.]|nr:5-formyltetrahydrofolate cyclo-ligase [Paucimonas sp.]
MLLAQRKAMSSSQRAAMNRALSEAMLAWCDGNGPALLALYMPMRGEPDLLQACEILVAKGTSLALPVVVEKNAPLAFAAWKPGDPLVKDLAGVDAPAQRRLVDPDTLLIPCLGYNGDRYRLGYGAGYYDRTLAARPGVRAIGVAWSDSRVDFAPDVFDQPLHLILTEAGPV